MSGKNKAITPKHIVSALQKNGFVLKRTRGSHHIFQHGVTKRRVVVSMHNKDLPKGTLYSILKQAGLSYSDL